MPSHLPPLEGHRSTLTPSLIVAPRGSTVSANTSSRTNAARPTLVLAASGVGSTPETANTKGRFTTAASTELNTPDIKLEDFLGKREICFSDPSKHSPIQANPAHSVGMATVERGVLMPSQGNSTTFYDFSPTIVDQVHQENEMDMKILERNDDPMDIATVSEINNILKPLDGNSNSPLTQSEINNVVSLDINIGPGLGPVPFQVIDSTPSNQASNFETHYLTQTINMPQQPGDTRQQESPPNFSSLLDDDMDQFNDLSFDQIFPNLSNDPQDVTNEIDLPRGSLDMILNELISGNEQPGSGMNSQEEAISKLMETIEELSPVNQPRAKESVTLYPGGHPSIDSTQPSTGNSVQPLTVWLDEASSQQYDMRFVNPMTLEVEDPVTPETLSHQNGTLQPQPAPCGPEYASTSNAGMTTDISCGMSAFLEASHTADLLPVDHQTNVSHGNTTKSDRGVTVRVRRIPKRPSRLSDEYVCEKSVNKKTEGVGTRANDNTSVGKVKPIPATIGNMESVLGIGTTKKRSGRRKRDTRELTDEEKYRRARDLNNEASKRFRQRKKCRIAELQEQADALTAKNEELKEKREILSNRVSRIKALHLILQRAIRESLRNR